MRKIMLFYLLSCLSIGLRAQNAAMERLFEWLREQGCEPSKMLTLDQQSRMLSYSVTLRAGSSTGDNMEDSLFRITNDTILATLGRVASTAYKSSRYEYHVGGKDTIEYYISMQGEDVSYRIRRTLTGKWDGTLHYRYLVKDTCSQQDYQPFRAEEYEKLAAKTLKQKKVKRQRVKGEGIMYTIPRTEEPLAQELLERLSAVTCDYVCAHPTQKCQYEYYWTYGTTSPACVLSSSDAGRDYHVVASADDKGFHVLLRHSKADN